MSKDETAMVNSNDHHSLHYFLRQCDAGAECPASVFPLNGCTPEELDAANKILLETYDSGGLVDLAGCIKQVSTSFDDAVKLLMQHAANEQLKKDEPQLWSMLQGSSFRRDADDAARIRSSLAQTRGAE